MSNNQTTEGTMSAREAEQTEPNELSAAERGAYLDRARTQYQSEGEIEIDDDATVSHSDEGAYVQAWVWVDKPECSACAEDGEYAGADECPACGQRDDRAD